MKILAIDDNQDNLISLQALVRESFSDVTVLTVLTALDGPSGLELARKEDPDVILLDIIMPVMDGFEVCRKLKASAATSGIPVVFVTAIKGDRESRIKALECGAEAFLAKPIDESELTAQIRAMVKIKAINSINKAEKSQLALIVEEKTQELNKTYTATLNLLDDLNRENEARKKSEILLQESEQNYRTIVESGQALIWTSGTDTLCNFFNSIWCEYTGRSLEQEMGNGWIDGVFPDDLQTCVQIYLDAFNRREKFSMEYRLRTHTGEYRWIQDNGSPRYNSNGDFIGYIGHCLDVHERRQFENALKYEKYLMNTLMENIPDEIYFKDQESKFIKCNKKQLSLFCLTSVEEVIGKTDFDFFSLEHAQQAYADEQEIIKTGKPISKEEKETWIGVPDTWVWTTKRPLTDKAGGVIGTFGVSVDITEHKIAEEKIKTLLDEKELILKEVHHRIKNNMNSIYGMLLLQTGTLSDSQAIGFLETAANRVRSMMLLYTKLYQTLDFTETSVLNYLPYLIDEIMENYSFEKKVIVETKIDDFILDVKKMQPLGIIINELLTNIMKYAFSDTEVGKISVTVSLQKEIVTVIIADNGTGIPDSVDFNKSTGFGLVLVNGLTNQLNGTIRIERENGTKIILEFEK